MMKEEFNEALTKVVAERFERAVIGRPQATSEYGGQYHMLRTVIVGYVVDDTHIDCTEEALLGAFTAWLGKIKAFVPRATTIVWRRQPEWSLERDIRGDCFYTKLYVRAHALTEEAWQKGPVGKTLDE